MGDSRDTISQIFNQRYELRQKIGTGGMARVYLGYDTNLGREVAIKVLHEHLAEDPMFKERFEREARIVATLNHPNIVQVYDYATAQKGDENVCYMVMSLLQGKSLRDILETHNTQETLMSHDRILAIMTDLCSALQYAHDKGMIHRDIKPANIIINPEERAILTDFGIARMVQGTQFTQEGTTVGTPTYMSPEQATGATVDARGDIYALGIVLYELLVGHPPFHDDGTLSVMLKHMTEPIPPLSNYDFLDNPQLDAVILKVLSKAPDTRYQTAEAFLDDLKRAFGGELTQAEQFLNVTTQQLEAIKPPSNAQKTKTQTLSITIPKPTTKGVWMILALGLGLILAIVMLGMVSRNTPAPSTSQTTAPNPVYFVTDFTDDFGSRFPQDNSAGLIRQITSEGYQITNNRNRQAIASLFEAEVPYTNFIIQLKGQLNEGSSPASGYGIVFRYVDENNYNVFAVDGLGRFSIWVRQDGRWIELRNMDETWTRNETVMPMGNSNTLEIEVYQNSLAGYVNGEAVVMLTDETIALGQIGIYVASTEDSNTDVLITTYQVMEATSAMTDSMTGVDSMTGEETAMPQVSP